MISNTIAFVCCGYAGPFFQTSDNTVYSIHEIFFLDKFLSATGSYQCCFIANIRDIGSGETRSLACQKFCIDTLIYFNRA